MTVAASTIVYEAQRAMNDLEGVRTPASDIVRFINRAQRDIHLARPDTTAETRVVSHAEGYRFSLPADIAVLIDIPANATGKMRQITRIDMALLDATEPEWRSASKKGEVTGYMQDNRHPRQYLLYPPVLAGTQLIMELSKYPVDIPIPPATATWASVAGNITLADEWSTTLLNMTLFYAYMTDLEGANNSSLASNYKALAEQALGTQIQAASLAAKRDGETK